jgi:hypothetical protein
MAVSISTASVHRLDQAAWCDSKLEVFHHEVFHVPLSAMELASASARLQSLFGRRRFGKRICVVFGATGQSGGAVTSQGTAIRDI